MLKHLGKVLLQGLTITALAMVAVHAYGQTGRPAGESEVFNEVRIASDAFQRGAPLPDWVDVAKELPEATEAPSSAIRIADTHFLVAGNPTVFVHRATQAKNAAALDELGQPQLTFNPAFQKLRLHTLRVVRGGMAQDRLESANVRFLQRETGLEKGTYDGIVTVAMLIGDLRVGDTVEIMYSIVGSNPVMGDRFMDVAGWDQGVPTEWRRVTLRHPRSRSIQWRFMGDVLKSFPTPTETRDGDFKVLRWEERRMTVPVFEQFAPPSTFSGRWLQFSEFSSWQEVSGWATQLFPRAGQMDPQLQEIVRAIRTKPTAREQVAAALAWVQQEIRYFSVSFGESSHRPHTPAITLQRRYGDCKDKTYLLMSILQALDIEAHPVLVSLAWRRGVNKLLPTPYAFDHAVVLVRVDGQSYYLDPTRDAQPVALEKLGQPLEGAEVLVVEPKTLALQTIQSDSSVGSIQASLHEALVLSALDGDGQLETRRSWTGVEAERRRTLFTRLSKDQLDRAVLEPYERRYPGIRSASSSLVEDDTANNRLVLVNKFVIPKIAIKRNDEWGIRFAASSLGGVFDVPPSPTRKLPLAINAHPAQIRYTLEVEFPKQVSVVRDPATRVVRNKAFDLSVQESFRGNTARVHIELNTLRNEVSPSEMSEFMEDLRKIDRLVPPAVVVSKADIKDGGFLGLAPNSLQQTIATRLSDRIEKVTKSIESGRLSGNDLVDAYCDRAEALADSGKGADALKDGQLAVKLSPNSPDAYSCRGSAYFVLGDFSRAAADFSRAITLGKAEFMMFYRRGHARFYMGQFPAALEDFSKAAQPGFGDSDGTLYAELWRTWTQKRIGQPAQSEQIAFASKDPKGEWPRPALAMLHGLITIDDMLKLVDRKKGDDREMTLVEAYFYAGQDEVVRGNKARAAEFFRMTRAKGVTVYIEHVSAGFELESLGSNR